MSKITADLFAHVQPLNSAQPSDRSRKGGGKGNGVSFVPDGTGENIASPAAWIVYPHHNKIIYIPGGALELFCWVVLNE